jgi:hypothetical protein
MSASDPKRTYRISNLIGKLDLLRVVCSKCERYRLHRLIDERGRDAKLIEWLGEITAA